jgi:hypothetical protein
MMKNNLTGHNKTYQMIKNNCHPPPRDCSIDTSAIKPQQPADQVFTGVPSLQEQVIDFNETMFGIYHAKYMDQLP